MEVDANLVQELPIAENLQGKLQMEFWCLESQRKIIEEVNLRKLERRPIKNTKVQVPILYELIDRSSGRSVGYAGRFDDYPTPLEGQLPVVKLVDGVLWVGNRHLDLHRRPQIARLFAAFCASNNEPISRDELLAKVYKNATDVSNCSARLLESRRAAIVKMVSRARKLITQRFGEAYGQVEWLTYKPEHQGWRFMRRTVKTC